MRVGFAGTPVFAQQALDALIEAGHDVVVALTQPDRAAGRGLKLVASPVKQAALRHGITVYQPSGLKLDGKYAQEAKDVHDALAALNLDVLIVAAYGLILPSSILDLPAHGCLNIHASLLPRWRGAAPIQRAIEAGDSQTGVTIMQMDVGLDTGDMLLTHTIEVSTQDTAHTLHDKLARLGAESIVQAMGLLEEGDLHPTPQPTEGISYAQKILKTEAALDLSESASLLSRRVRAFNPFPGATIKLPGLKEPIKVWQAIAINAPAHGQPGDLMACNQQAIDVATGQGVLRLLELQRPGGKRQPADAFVQFYQQQIAQAT